MLLALQNFAASSDHRHSSVQDVLSFASTCSSFWTEQNHMSKLRKYILPISFRVLRLLYVAELQEVGRTVILVIKLSWCRQLDPVLHANRMLHPHEIVVPRPIIRSLRTKHRKPKLSHPSQNTVITLDRSLISTPQTERKESTTDRALQQQALFLSFRAVKKLTSK